MAKTAKVQVVDKENTTGKRIMFRQSGTKLYFGDDDIVVKCDTRQREHQVQVDVTVDRDGNLQTGAGPDRYYVAEVLIPPTEYTEPKEDAEGTESGGEREALPVDMGKVLVTLWGLYYFPDCDRGQGG